jgi:hypothetical protein
MYRKLSRHFLCLLSSTLFLTCTPDLKTPQANPGKANFIRSIALGGDFMAGYQDQALYLDGQNRCIPALLARVFQSVGGTSFRQALMPDNLGLGLNPKPWQSAFVSSSHLRLVTDCSGFNSLQPICDSLPKSQARPYLTGVSGNAIQNLAVPFAPVSQLFNPALGLDINSGNKNPFYNRFAGNVGHSTVFSDAINQNATFFSLWVGMEDIYTYAMNGGNGSTISSSIAFSAYLDTLLNGLTANGAKGVIATIPDFRSFPFYSLLPYNGALLTQGRADTLNIQYATAGINNIQFSSGPNPFVISDLTVSSHYRQLVSGEYVLLGIPSDSIKCQSLGSGPGHPLPDRYVLTSAEVALIDGAISMYNSIILQKAGQYGLALVDMQTYFNSVNRGIKWDGEDFNAQFISGGFFSLDGYHPNQKGYALLANEFIKAINTTYASSIPWVNCPECNGVLFP